MTENNLSSPSSKKGDEKMAVKVKTGGIVPTSGQYRPTGKSTEVTFVQGKRVPPTHSGGTTFTLVDKTKHKGGK